MIRIGKCPVHNCLLKFRVVGLDVIRPMSQGTLSQIEWESYVDKKHEWAEKLAATGVIDVCPHCCYGEVVR